MKEFENVGNRQISHVDKWLTMGVMERVDQVRYIAEMLSATMEDLSDQLIDIETSMEALTDATEAIDEKIEELMEMIQESMGYPSQPFPDSSPVPLPF